SRQPARRRVAAASSPLTHRSFRRSQRVEPFASELARNGVETTRAACCLRADIFSGAGATSTRSRGKVRGIRGAGAGIDVAPGSCVPVEIVIGRWLACCAHPSAAWRLLPVSGRLLLVAAYAGFGFLLAFIGLSLT